MKMKTKKVWKVTSNLITVILFLLLIFMTFVVVSSKASGGEPSFLGYQLKTVLSGSMEPTFKTGSIIAVKPISDTTNLKEKDIVTFMEQDQKIVTHRIIKVIKQGDQVLYQTKGDNNEDADVNPIMSQNVVAKYTGFTIPLLGYLIDFAKSSKGMAALLITPGVLLLFYSVITILKALKELDKPKKESEKTA
ncbi:signal peptidase I SipW [Neobacillus drentensis]|uniref:signal peptidase I SipW n=1 Tax=Neobacillus drentensis TaxID=220684 RepID=UPI000825A025|nr:signal peptidase I [Neobacillus drentensis]